MFCVSFNIIIEVVICVIISMYVTLCGALSEDLGMLISIGLVNVMRHSIDGGC